MGDQVDDTLTSLLREACERGGTERVRMALGAITRSSAEVASSLIIVPSGGLHPIGDFGVAGELFIASTGQLDFSTARSATDAFEDILRTVSRKLRAKPWNEVYLVPFGPAVLTAQIKLAVYRVLHIETVDLLYTSGMYLQIAIDQRDVLLT